MRDPQRNLLNFWDRPGTPRGGDGPHDFNRHTPCPNGSGILELFSNRHFFSACPTNDFDGGGCYPDMVWSSGWLLGGKGAQRGGMGGPMVKD